MFAGQSDPDQASRPIAIARVAIGFAQGLALYGLNEWEKHGLTGGVASPLFCACAMLILFLPVVLLGGLRTLRTRTLIVWGHRRGHCGGARGLSRDDRYPRQ
uniref:Uncharacterized protein n=1 Tax=Phenylobacterium glaciei TaxID=2803784 RepID=A0A974P5X3_9CAUL|nr:hypothetical protein JKL49_08685 [Phenylobacterium glaciei]